MGGVSLYFHLSMRQVYNMCSLLIHSGFVLIFFGDFHRNNISIFPPISSTLLHYARHHIYKWKIVFIYLSSQNIAFIYAAYRSIIGLVIGNVFSTLFIYLLYVSFLISAYSCPWNWTFACKYSAAWNNNARALNMNE